MRNVRLVVKVVFRGVVYWGIGVRAKWPEDEVKALRIASRQLLQPTARLKELLRAMFESLSFHRELLITCEAANCSLCACGSFLPLLSEDSFLITND